MELSGLRRRDILIYSQSASSMVRFCPMTPHNRPYNGVILARPIKYAVPSHEASHQQSTRQIFAVPTNEPARKYEPISICRFATIVAPRAEQNDLS